MKTKKCVANDICTKCGGLMREEKFDGVVDESNLFYFVGFRCLICGRITDELIERNRVDPPVVRTENYPRVMGSG